MHNAAERYDVPEQDAVKRVTVDPAKSHKYAVLRAPCRVWAVAAALGEAERLRAVREEVLRRAEPDDRLVFLGNMIGRGAQIRRAVDEVLLFRRDFLARRGAEVDDIVLLRGGQEEMWHKLLQLQFASNPFEVLSWMLEQGVGATIAAYGGNADEGLMACRQGAVSLNRWTSGLREALQRTPGHQDYMSALRHAAFTRDGSLLLVSAGIDPRRPLDAQEDTFWWAPKGFDSIDSGYFDCRLVVRGFDPAHRGVKVGPYSASLDGGCGYGGRLVAACLTTDGELADTVEA